MNIVLSNHRKISFLNGLAVNTLVSSCFLIYKSNKLFENSRMQSKDKHIPKLKKRSFTVLHLNVTYFLHAKCSATEGSLYLSNVVVSSTVRR